MRIEIENTSSPGASFTSNTNEVLLKISEWINTHSEESLPFKDFRAKLEQDEGINDNNARNIYPLLKNSGFIRYETRGNITVKNFFTNTGKAYIKALDTKNQIVSSAEYTDEQKKLASQKLDAIISEIIRSSLSTLLKTPDLSYAEPFKGFIAYVLRYKKINKLEFAYFLYERKKHSLNEALNVAEQNVSYYRSGDLVFEVAISVRNDLELRQKTNHDKRQEGLSFLTSFTYFSSLLLQAGFVSKKDGYFVLNEDLGADLKKLSEV